MLGRFIADDEAHPATGARVVVLSHAFWRRAFGGDSAVVGTTLRVKGLPYRVVGIAPRGFRGLELYDTGIWLPLYALADGTDRRGSWHTFAGSSNLKFVGRQRSPWRPEQVAAELSRERALYIADAQQEEHLPRQHVATRVTLGSVTGALGSNGQRIPEGTVVVWLVGVASVLLAIACANVASLLLLRTLHRRREIGVRLALGMSRSRLAALLFAESAVLNLAGGAAALVLVAGGGAWVRQTLLPGMFEESSGVEWRTVLVSAGVVVLTALLTGLAPVLQSAQPDMTAALRDGAQYGTTRRSRAYWSLLVMQTALSAVLLVGAGLFLRSLHRVTTTDLGLDTEHSWVVSLHAEGSGRSPREIAAFYERVLERVRTVRGVRSASLAADAPLRSARGMLLRTHPGGEWVRTIRDSPVGNWVADGYFDAVGMRLVAGPSSAS